MNKLVQLKNCNARFEFFCLTSCKKCWLCRHTFMANSPLVAISVRVADPGYIASNERAINYEIERTWKEAVVAYSQATIPVFAWRDGGKPRKPSVRIACFRAKIWPAELQNTKQECQLLDHDVRWHSDIDAFTLQNSCKDNKQAPW
jgi:hypothetical protein